MCFVDLEKAFDSVPQVVLWGVLREYGVSLLRAIQSLYDHYKSLFCIAGNKLDSFLVGDGLRQGCPLSLILFIIFMDRISRRSQVAEGFHFGGLRISSLLFTDDVVLLASSGDGLQFALERFAAECEAVGMRITTSKSEATVLSRKKVECPLRVRDETLPQMEEFKYLGVLFTSDGKREREIDRWIDRVRTQSLEMPALSITLEYYTPQEMVGFKKTNHRVKKTWKKEKKSIADDLHLNDTCSSDFGSRTRGRGLKQENDEDQEVKKEEKVVMHEIHLLSGDIRMTEMDISDNEEFTPPEHAVIEEDEAEQELQKQRNLKQMQLLKDSGEKVEQHFFFNATSEFCRILGDIPTYIMDFEQEEEKDDAGVHLDHEQNQPDFATACATILDEEPIVNSGLVAALLLCKNKGLLDTQVQKVARVKCIEDKMGFDDKYSRREEYRGFMQDFKEDGCKPDVKIEYVEESGRKLTPKEGSGKMKTERRMKKLEVEALLKKMSSSDTTLGTVALLQERQKSQKTPSIVLGNSMNANTITK
uniref:Reverse transcriptase domain-containing protein n=1 Tax=Haplochromis burtoni TaxID=8153 RepID=A0A3Q2XCZ8_HAPBU